MRALCLLHLLTSCILLQRITPASAVDVKTSDGCINDCDLCPPEKRCMAGSNEIEDMKRRYCECAGPNRFGPDNNLCPSTLSLAIIFAMILGGGLCSMLVYLCYLMSTFAQKVEHRKKERKKRGKR